MREIERILPANILELLRGHFIQFHREFQKKRGDKQKLYSLHEPHVNCLSKAKDHKKYEFGTKVSITVRRDSKIIVDALALE